MMPTGTAVPKGITRRSEELLDKNFSCGVRCVVCCDVRCRAVQEHVPGIYIRILWEFDSFLNELLNETEIFHTRGFLPRCEPKTLTFSTFENFMFLLNFS